MRILALDTSTPLGSVALWEDGCVRGCVTWDTSLIMKASHAAQLLPATRHVLDLTGCSFDAIDAFGVACGPGSFTGLRVGIATAQGWGRATAKPVAPVSTLDALAQAGRAVRGTLCVALDARKHEVYAALYAVEHGCVERLSDDLLLAPERLGDLAPRPDALLGSGVTAYAADLRAALGARALLLGVESAGVGGWFPTAPYVAAAAARSLAAGPLPRAALRPRYVRAADAEVKAAGRGGAAGAAPERSARA